MHAAVKEEAERILAEAKARVPVGTGELRDSGHVVMSDDGRKINAKIVFDAPHALVVHEDLEAQHPEGGRAKFLESALKEKRCRMPQTGLRRRSSLGSRFNISVNVHRRHIPKSMQEMAVALAYPEPRKRGDQLERNKCSAADINVHRESLIQARAIICEFGADSEAVNGE